MNKILLVYLLSHLSLHLSYGEIQCFGSINRCEYNLANNM